MPRLVGQSCPLPIKPPSESDIALAEEGDRMAKARLRMNAIRIKQREEEIAKWHAANPDSLSDAGPAVGGARMVSPRGEKTRYVCVVVRSACVVCPRGYSIAGVGVRCGGLSSRTF